MSEEVKEIVAEQPTVVDSQLPEIPQEEVTKETLLTLLKGIFYLTYFFYINLFLQKSKRNVKLCKQNCKSQNKNMLKYLRKVKT